MTLFKAARTMDHLAMRREKISVDEFVNLVKSFKRYQVDSPCISDSIESMKADWKKYLQACRVIPVADGQEKFDVRKEYAHNFWKTRWIDFKSLATFARFVLHFTPSSAAAERVFSMLRAAFDNAQMANSLEDLTAGSVKVAYNNRN